jgi:hypothetical protein
MKKNDGLLLKLAHYCKEPRLIEDVAEHLGVSSSGAYNFLRKMLNSGDVRRTQDKTAFFPKYFYITNNPELLPPFTGDNSIKYGRQKKEFISNAIEINKGYHVKDCIKVIDNRMTVRGFDGYHSGKIKRADKRYYVGCSANII